MHHRMSWVQSTQVVERTLSLPNGALRVLQLPEAAELPDDGPIEWAPIAPYWSVLWRSGVALARELDAEPLSGRRVVELGCGLGLPSIAAARAGAHVLATDESAEGLELAARNAEANGVSVETAAVDWRNAAPLEGRAPFDVALASDLLYEPGSATALLAVLPRLAQEAWVADPGRPEGHAFLEEARSRWIVDTRVRGVVQVHRLRLG
jgi:predicted nicotinamide N-methyase